jgi:sugar phosphate isomerase/epimerase
VLNRRDLLRSTFAAGSSLALFHLAQAAPRQWRLGINTYCLRFWNWNDRQLFDFCLKEKLDAIFLQDSLDPGVMEPKHWAEVRAWAKDAQLHIETGGSALLPKTPEGIPQSVATLRKNIGRAQAMGATMVRALLASDRYSMPDGPVEQHMETGVRILKEVRQQTLDANLKIGIENHKDIQAWRTRQLIEAAGTDFVGSYLDTGNPVFVAEDPLTTVEELGPYALSFHLRDSVIYEHPDGIAVQWVPLGEGTVDFKALVARATELMSPQVHIYCKPITARPPVVLPVYGDEFWTKWFPGARSRDLARFEALARRGRPWNKPHLMADLPEVRDRYRDALKLQQMEHMEQSLAYCRKDLNLGVRWRT